MKMVFFYFSKEVSKLLIVLVISLLPDRFGRLKICHLMILLGLQVALAADAEFGDELCLFRMKANIFFRELNGGIGVQAEMYPRWQAFFLHLNALSFLPASLPHSSSFLLAFIRSTLHFVLEDDLARPIFLLSHSNVRGVTVIVLLFSWLPCLVSV